MVFKLRNKGSDREKLMFVKKRSEDVHKERPRKMGTRLTSIFKKPSDKHVTLKSQDIEDDPTPPSSPDGMNEELEVSVVASPYLTLFQEEQSYGGTTISDLSASVVRTYAKRAHASPIKEEEDTQSKTVRVTDYADYSRAEPAVKPLENADSTAGCSPEVIVNTLFGLLEESCGTKPIAGFGSVKTGGESDSRASPPSWGTPPSIDDEDYTLQYGSAAGSLRTSAFGTTIISEDKRGGNPFSSMASTSHRRDDRSERSHENFELILDPSILTGDASHPKRKPAPWRRSKPQTTGEELQNEIEEIDENNLEVTLRAGSPYSTPSLTQTIKKAPIFQRISQRAGNKKAAVIQQTGRSLSVGAFVDTDGLSESVRSSSDVDQILDEAEQHRNAVKGGHNHLWSNLTNSLPKRRTGSEQKHNTDNTIRSDSPVLSMGAESRRETQSSTASQTKNVWKSAQDAHGKTYYYHRLTRNSTWTKPCNFDAPSQQEQDQPLRNGGRPETEKSRVFDEQSKEEAFVPSDIMFSENGLSAEAQQKIEAGESQSKSVGQGPSILKKASSTDSERNLRATKEEIAKLLKMMAPPTGDSVVNLMKRYEGREEDLLDQLRDLVKKQPFDEPLKSAPSFTDIDHDDNEPGPLHVRTRTANTTNTGITEKTERINNTGKSGSIFESIKEGEESFDDGSISSNNFSEPNYPTNQSRYRAARIEEAKKKLASGRTRDLRVEEFSSSRLKAETFNEKATAPPIARQRKVNAAPDPIQSLTLAPLSSQNIKYGESFPEDNDVKDHDVKKDDVKDNQANDVNDNDDTDLDTFTDTVSALSQSDAEFNNRKSKFDQARKIALDDAIRRRDWDLAASVTDNMRHRSIESSRGDENDGDMDYREWTQTELDQFISENHWDAVAKYIAQMRDNNEEGLLPRRPRNGDILEPGSTMKTQYNDTMKKNENYNESIKKRFGARSQLQHYNDDHSISSWESESFFESDYSSTSSLSFSNDAGKLKLTSRREFAC